MTQRHGTMMWEKYAATRPTAIPTTKTLMAIFLHISLMKCACPLLSLAAYQSSVMVIVYSPPFSLYEVHKSFLLIVRWLATALRDGSRTSRFSLLFILY